MDLSGCGSWSIALSRLPYHNITAEAGKIKGRERGIKPSFFGIDEVNGQFVKKDNYGRFFLVFSWQGQHLFIELPVYYRSFLQKKIFGL